MIEKPFKPSQLSVDDHFCHLQILFLSLTICGSLVILGRTVLGRSANFVDGD